MPASEEPAGKTSQALGSALKGVYFVSLAGDGTQQASCDGASVVPHADALQACINKANADGGGTVLVGAGTYSTGTWPLTLKSNVTLMGQGHLGAKLAPPPGSTQIIGTVENNTAIVGLTLDQTNASQSAIGLTGSHTNVRIEDNLFTFNSTGSGSRDGIDADPAAALQRITIRGNAFTYNGGTGIAFYPVNLRFQSGTIADTIRVENNDFSIVQLPTTGAPVIRLEWQYTGTPIPARGVVVSGNSIRGNVQYGIQLWGAYDAQVTGNTVEAGTYPVVVYQYSLASCGATVTGNRFSGSQATWVDANCKANTLLAGNTSNLAVTLVGGSFVTAAGMGKAAVAVRAYRSGSQNFTAGTDTALLYNTEDVDNGSNFDPATGTFTAPLAGVYDIRACARVNSTNFTAGDTADITLKTAGSNFSLNRSVSGGSSSFTVCTNDLVVLASGATVQAFVNASGAATTRTVSGTGKYSSYFSAQRVSD
jgi:hypothetical protein